MAAKSTGNCYLCGASIGKTAIKNHLPKHCEENNGDQGCCLLKIEDKYNKDYWLYIDVPEEKTLQAVDTFLRKIWLECCGHLSQFYAQGNVKVGKSRKLSGFIAEEKLFYDYDFGSTTELVITCIGNIKRPAQKEVVRLLARNTPPVFRCTDCEEKAEYIYLDSESDNPFYCAKCIEEYGDEMVLPITNSPRMGVCGYTGELDVFAFDPISIKK